MPPTLRKGARRASALDDASRGRGAAAAGERSGLVERLERARASRGREARDASRTEELEWLRRKGFEEFPLLRGHEDELLAVTGELARVLPTRTEYRLHTGEEWDVLDHLVEQEFCPLRETRAWGLADARASLVALDDCARDSTSKAAHDPAKPEEVGQAHAVRLDGVGRKGPPQEELRPASMASQAAIAARILVMRLRGPSRPRCTLPCQLARAAARPSRPLK